MHTNNLKIGFIAFTCITLVSMTAITSDIQDPWVAPDEYQSMENPYADWEDEDRIGRTLYAKHCKFCHGSKGKGDGNQSKLLKTPVADFTKENFKGQTDGSIYYKLATGRNEMPGFKKIITDDEDFWMVINYIKSF